MGYKTDILYLLDNLAYLISRAFLIRKSLTLL